MVLTTEIRIGNFIKRAEHKNWQKQYWNETVQVGYNEMYLLSLDDQQLWYAPIELTIDWLAKFRFRYKPISQEVYDQIWDKDSFQIWEHDAGFCHDFHHGGDIRYVHQLQNLYFALTGEELVCDGV